LEKPDVPKEDEQYAERFDLYQSQGYENQPEQQEKQFDRVDHRPLPYCCRASCQRVIANEVTATRDDLLFGAVLGGQDLPIRTKRAPAVSCHRLVHNHRFPFGFIGFAFAQCVHDHECEVRDKQNTDRYRHADADFHKQIEEGLRFNSRLAALMIGCVCRLPLWACRREGARELDPLNVANRALSAQIAFAGRDYSNAVQLAEQAIAIDPEFWIGYLQLGQAHEQLGNTDLALEALVNAARLSGGNSKTMALRGHIFAKLGKTEDARGVLSSLEAVSRNRYVPPYAMALVHAGLRENDRALDWLNRAHDAHDVHLALLTIDPKWDAFRADPRFMDLLGRCAFANPALVAPLDS
jgi:tetratricopeptide (TPR) repeat protein